jgi:hypothetical protein
VTGIVGLAGLSHHVGEAVPLIALALSLLGSAVGVMRMRAWGILLGAFTSIVTLIAGAFMHDAAGLALSVAALPGLMLLLPVVLAKRERAKAEATSARLRVATHVGWDDAPSRVRVATDGVDAFDDVVDSESAVRAAAPAPAARAQA